MIQALSQHLLSVLDAVLHGSPTGAIGVIFSSLCHVAPRVLLRYDVCVVGACVCVVDWLTGSVGEQLMIWTLCSHCPVFYCLI